MCGCFQETESEKGKEKRCLFPTRGGGMDSHSCLVSSGKGVNDGFSTEPLYIGSTQFPETTFLTLGRGDREEKRWRHS